MRNLILIMILFLGPQFTIEAQDCNPYFPLNEGISYEINQYDKKKKLSSTTAFEVLEVRTQDGAVHADIQTHIKDGKGKSLSNSDYTVSCEDGVYKIDISKMIPQASMEAYRDMDVEVSGDALAFPQELVVGASLPDGKTEMAISSGGVKIMKMNIAITNRQVLSKESVSTPAGTFEAYKISYDVEMKTIMSMKTTSIVWVAEKVGMVRSEDYNKKGKLVGYSELAKIEGN